MPYTVVAKQISIFTIVCCLQFIIYMYIVISESQHC